jgi:hypothetical protein
VVGFFFFFFFEEMGYLLSSYISSFTTLLLYHFAVLPTSLYFPLTNPQESRGVSLGSFLHRSIGYECTVLENREVEDITQENYEKNEKCCFS